MGNKELLRRIDERDYLTEREHREFLSVLNKELEKLEEIRNTFKVEKEETINQNHYWLIGKKKPHYSYMITKEQYDKWNRWLDNEI